MSETDSDVFARWQKLQFDLAIFRTGKIPPPYRDTKDFEDDYNRRRRSICIDWREILSIKRSGRVTDRTNFIKFEKVAYDFAKLHGLRVYIKYDTELTGELNAPSETQRFWVASVIYYGDYQDFNLRQWEKWTYLLNIELSPFDFIDETFSRSGADTIEEELPADYDERLRAKYPPESYLSYGDDEEEEDEDEGIADPEQPDELDRYSREYRSWLIDTLIWTGPT